MSERAAALKRFMEAHGISEEDARRLEDLLERFEGLEKTAQPSPSKPSSDTFVMEEGASPGDTFIETPVNAETLTLSDALHPIGSVPAIDYARLAKVGRYRDLGVIGVGGMGEVRSILDEDLNRTLAMKIIHPELMNSRRSVARFVEEAQIEAQLQHPNIIPIHEIGRLSDGRHYFTMKQVRGTEFFNHIQAVHEVAEPHRWRTASNGTTFRDLIQVFEKICVTVAYAHSRGVIHRDLKPDNIMIGDFGEVLVVDWGLAKVLGRVDSEESNERIVTVRSRTNVQATRVGSISGTPCYMAPEQAQGLTREIGTHTDVYTLGAILYEILSGDPPYLGSSAEEVIEKVKSSAPPSLGSETSRVSQSLPSQFPNPVHVPPLSAGASRIPNRLRQICEQAMEREISDRTLSAQSLATDVRAWLEGAEKRDKALVEVEAAKQSLEQAAEQDRRAMERWSETHLALEQYGPDSEAPWQRWAEMQKTEAHARRLRRQHLQQLLGALVHAPDLEEAHLALARLRLTERVEAAAMGDRSAQEVHEQQFRTHLQYLSPVQRAELEDRLKAKLNDAITGNRSRRGVLIGRRAIHNRVGTQLHNRDSLVTLVGTAGVGKTRLALEIADELRTDSLLAFFCDLTEATETRDVIRLVAQGMGLRLRNADPLKHLVETLGKKPTLLVLDNLEQVVEPIGALIRDQFSALPHLQILSTSRTKLGLPSEVVIPVEPMTLLESVELFARRAQTADARFEIQKQNRGQVCALVQKLDGLPLAIELAAARLNMLSLDEISQHLGERFSLLRSRGRKALALEGALDWSWDLLRPWAQAALSQASIFRGGFSLIAAEQVIDVHEDADSPALFDILGELVENSLLRRDPGPADCARYSMLESIRAYASQKLISLGAVAHGLSGDDAKIQVQNRHAGHYAQMGDHEVLRTLEKSDRKADWDDYFLELDNLIVAIDHGTPDTQAKCCLAAVRILALKGPVSLGVDITAKVLARPQIPRPLRVGLEIERSKCLRISGRMREARQSINQDRPEFRAKPASTPRPDAAQPSESDLRPAPPISPLFEAARRIQLGLIEREESNSEEAKRYFREALAIYLTHDDQSGIAQSFNGLGNVEQDMGHIEEAIDYLEKALKLYRKLENRQSEGIVLGNLGNIFRFHGRQVDALDYYQEALEIHRASGNRKVEAKTLGNLGMTYQELGRIDDAFESISRSIKIHREVGNKRGIGVELGNLGIINDDRGDPDAALQNFRESLAIHREIGNLRGEGLVLGNLGETLRKLCRFDEALETLQSAVEICDETLPLAGGVFRASMAIILAHQGRFEAGTRLLVASEEKIRPYPREMGKFHCLHARFQILQGHPGQARNTIEKAKQIAVEEDASHTGLLRQDIHETENQLEAFLSGPEHSS